MKLLFGGICVATVLALGNPCPAADVAADVAPAKISNDQRAVQRLVNDFAKARRNPGKRAELIEKSVELGGNAPARLLEILNKELSPQLKGYREKLTKIATGLEKERTRSIDLEEVNRLRTSVLDLGKNPELTKEMIVEVADPAMEKLAAMLLPDHSVVFASTPALNKQRAALMEHGTLWDKCAMAFVMTDKTETKAVPPSFEALLRGEEQQAMLQATPLDPQTRQTLAANAQLAGKLDSEELRCVAACNLTRNLLGLAALAIDPLLCQTARDHSHDMETKDFFAHESPVEGKKTPWDRAQRFGTTSSGENIAMGIAQGSAANEMWFHSPGHHRNMLGDHKRIGLGRSGAYWTEMFGQ